MNEFSFLPQSVSRNPRHDAANPDGMPHGTGRHVADLPANAPEPEEKKYEYTNSQAVSFFREKGFQIAARTVRNYCHQGSLDCKKIKFGHTLEWRINRDSLFERLEVLKKEGLQPAVSTNTNRSEQSGDTLRGNAATTPGTMPDVALPVPQNTQDPKRGHLAGTSRQDADAQTLDFLKEQITKKDEQLEAKDKVINNLLERDRETNILIRGLQGIVERMALPSRQGSDRVREAEQEEPEKPGDTQEGEGTHPNPQAGW